MFDEQRDWLEKRLDGTSEKRKGMILGSHNRNNQGGQGVEEKGGKAEAWEKEWSRREREAERRMGTRIGS